MAVTATTQRIVRERAASRCEYCHADERWQFIRFTLDHVVPQSADGGDDAENLALACRNCNERRGNRTEAVDFATQVIVPLFHPRRDEWSQHFAWSPDGLRLIGVTAVGRATIELLDINDDRHGGRIIQIRRRDFEDGLHPPVADPRMSN